MRVLFVTPECYPLIKTGGLADVAGALPVALARSGVDARVLMPAYPGVRDHLTGARKVARLPGLFGGDGSLVHGITPAGLHVWLVDAPHLFSRKGGGPYLGPDGHDWPDNDLRFAALSWAAAELSLGRVGISWLPDVAHLHDWQAGLTAAYLHYSGDPRPAILFTIHNLAYQGLFPATHLKALGLPPAAMEVDGLEYWGKVSFLKAGVRWSDRLSTVSPTYACEILTPAHGMGFDGLLRARADHLTGIVNGIDTEVWNPATDPLLTEPYTTFSPRRLSAKATCKAALQAELGLVVSADSPLFCVVSRLAAQKGLDLLLATLPRLLARGAQLAVLGSGDHELENGFHRAADLHPGQVAFTVGYDEALSHRLQAGADSIVVPSRFEPCGLTQLYGLRYGTLPVVARVGGLADTIIDANEAAVRDGVATGFQFGPVEGGTLAAALDRACDLYTDTRAWQRLQKRAMTRDVGWDVAAGQYIALYERLIHERR